MSNSKRPDSQPKLTVKALEVPYVPSKVPFKVLKSRKGYLVDPEDTKKIRKWVDENKDQIGDGRRLTKKELKDLDVNIGFNVAVVPNENDFQIVAIFFGKKSIIDEFGNEKISDKTLGSGAWGTVKLGQDLETKQFVAIKTQQSVLPSARRKHVNEFEIMKKVGAATGAFVYEPKGRNVAKYQKKIITGKDSFGVDIAESQSRAMMYIMDLATGESLNKLAGKLTLQEANHVALGMIELVNRLHKMGILHLDVKLENFIYDKETRVLKLIDYGESLHLDPESKEAEGVFRGSPAFLPPELKHFYDHDEAEEWKKQSKEVKRQEKGVTYFRYTPETDIYSLGIAMADLYRLQQVPKWDGNGKVPPTTIATQESSIFRDNSLVGDESEKKTVHSILQKMTTQQAEDRISLDEAASALQTFSVKHESHPKVAIVNVDEFKALSAEGGSFPLSMIYALKEFDEVIIVNPKKELDALEVKGYLQDRNEFISELEDDGVTVRHALYGSENPLEIAAQASRFDELNVVMPDSKYYYVTSETLELDQMAKLSQRAAVIQFSPQFFNLDNQETAKQAQEVIKKQVEDQVQAHSMKEKMRDKPSFATTSGVFARRPSQQSEVAAESLINKQTKKS